MIFYQREDGGKGGFAHCCLDKRPDLDSHTGPGNGVPSPPSAW